MYAEKYLQELHRQYSKIKISSSNTELNFVDIFVPIELTAKVAIYYDNSLRISLPLSKIDTIISKNPAIELTIKRMELIDILNLNQHACIESSDLDIQLIIGYFVELQFYKNITYPDILNQGNSNWAQELSFSTSLVKRIPYVINMSELCDELETDEDLEKNLSCRFYREDASNYLLIISDTEEGDVDKKNKLLTAIKKIFHDDSTQYIFVVSNGAEWLKRLSSSSSLVQTYKLNRLDIAKQKKIVDQIDYFLNSHKVGSKKVASNFFVQIDESSIGTLVETHFWLRELYCLYYVTNQIPFSHYRAASVVADKIIQLFFDVYLSRLEVEKNKINDFFCEIIYLIYDKNITGDFIHSIGKQYGFSTGTIKVLEILIKNNKFSLIEFNNNSNTFYLNLDSICAAMIAQQISKDSHYTSIIQNKLIEDYDKWKDIFINLIQLLEGEPALSMITLVLENLYETETNKDLYILISATAYDCVQREDPVLIEKYISLRNKLTNALIDIINSESESTQIRYEALSLLSCIGDQRKLNLRIPEFIKIESGPVMLGGDNLTSGKPYQFDLKYPYLITKVPITNFQYQCFLQENADAIVPYDENGIWDVERRIVEKRYLNHPVVGINVEEALRYCQWLQRQISLPQGYIVTLPSDAEWMKAMRGGIAIGNHKNQNPIRIYPWGNEEKFENANIPECPRPFHNTTPVGLFPAGASPYGVFDLWGNVLEWTLTSWGGEDVNRPIFTPPYSPTDGRDDLTREDLRIARGGSFLFSEGAVKCSCRLNPKERLPDAGFRIVISLENKNTTVVSSKDLDNLILKDESKETSLLDDILYYNRQIKHLIDDILSKLEDYATVAPELYKKFRQSFSELSTYIEELESDGMKEDRLMAIKIRFNLIRKDWKNRS